MSSLEVPFLFTLVGVPNNSRILEIGCGRGFGMPAISRRAAPSSIIGIDIDSESVAEASLRVRGDPSARVCAADAHQLPFRVAAFDVVVDFGTCYHVTDARAVLREILRVLVPGGVFIHETRASQWLSHPRSQAQSGPLPWDAVPALCPDRHFLLWAVRTKRSSAV